MLVALRKESVDRNIFWANSSRAPPTSLSARRAWIEIWCYVCARLLVVLSLSARRAWIEISTIKLTAGGTEMSLSARRAWIEMSIVQLHASAIFVALRKESVDRNA